jgi:acetolactate synthase-1/2/3 large subunit
MELKNHPINAAEALLIRLKANGVDYLFANGGTDFAPVIEGLSHGIARGADLPEAMIMPHETAAVGMAHGYYLLTGRAQSVMVHVNVGLANCVMGIINAASDNIPMLIMAGRTPITEHERFGSRMTPVQYGQEMRDQTAMVREAVKWDYEMRYGEQADLLIDRALAIANTEPKGPVYLALPREPLSEPWPAKRAVVAPRQATPIPPPPDAAQIEQAAEWLSAARNPVIVCQRGDPAKRLGPALAGFAERFALPVAEYWPVRNVLAGDHPMHAGYDSGPLIADADVILVIDAQVPWIARHHQPAADAKVIHTGPDPLFQRLPVRSFQSDLAITGDPAAIVGALHRALEGHGAGDAARATRIRAAGAERRAEAHAKAEAGSGAPVPGAPMTAAYVSHCLQQAIDAEAIVVNELGAVAAAMTIAGPNQFFSAPYSGGLGWGLPAAMGAKLADRDRLVVACIGDGSYMFANPVACHQIAEACDLAVLILVLNNGVWNAVERAARMLYPEGHAMRMNTMPITALTPSPDYGAIIGASRGWSEDVENGADLPAALARAVAVVTEEKRQALLNIRTGAV